MSRRHTIALTQQTALALVRQLDRAALCNPGLRDLLRIARTHLRKTQAALNAARRMEARATERRAAKAA